MKKVLLLLLLITLVILQKTIAQTPVAYYPFSGNANDAAGTSHGTVNGATLTTDRFGNANSAYGFDGVDDVIELNHNFGPFTELTVSAWYKVTATSPEIQAIVSSDNSGKFLHLQILTSGDVDNAVYLNPGPGALLLTHPMPVLNQWRHVAITAKSGESKLYINGVLMEVDNATYSTIAPADLLRIGSGYLNGRFFNGAIDEVKIFNTALTAGQILQEIVSLSKPLVFFPGGTGPGCSNTASNLNNGSSATGIGCGGGGAGFWGGHGGNGNFGGGGGGAAGLNAPNRMGGTGGHGMVIFKGYNASGQLILDTNFISGSSFLIPANVASIGIWAIGAGGGGAGSPASDASSGGGGGAGGICYKRIPITVPGTTITYVLGIGGAGGIDANNGQSGTATTVTLPSATLIANGGEGGYFNTGAVAAGGTYSGGDQGVSGGSGSGASGDSGGGGGGAIGGVNGVSNGCAGGSGGNANASLFYQSNYSSQFGNSVQMNGSTDNIDLGTSFTEQVFTLEMWVKPGATQGAFANIIDNNHTGFQNWVVQQDGSTTNYYIFGVHRSSGGTGIYFQLQANSWQHVALVKSATTIEAYVNGALVATAPWTGTVNYTAQFLRLGRWGGGGRHWNGSMDEVRIWNTVRTPAEIVANMNSQLTGNEAGLVAYYDMNRDGQGAGLTVENRCIATGASLNGTTVGTGSTPVFSPAVTQQKPGSGNAVSFDGMNDFTDISNQSFLNFGINQDFVVETWVKIPASQNYTISSDNIIIDKWGGFGSGSAYPFSIRVQNIGSPDANKITVVRTNDIGGAAAINSLNAMNDNKWHHIAFAKNGTVLSLYVDGVLNGTTTDVGAGNTGNSATVTIGKRNGAILQAFLTGVIDEVRIWNIGLSQSQIRDRMCRKVTSSDALYPNLVAYYNFDEGTGSTVFDATMNANNGTLINGPVRVTSGAAIGNASAHDYVNPTKTASLTHPGGESFTVTSTSGNPESVHIYRVDEKPNTVDGTQGVGANDKYFGVFQAGGSSPQYTAVYNYAGNPGIGDESTLRLYKRTDNSVTTWSPLAALPNEPANTITVTGESTEYILGSIGTPLPLRLLSFAGTKKNYDAILQWKTAHEVNVSHFELQRSENGVSFSTVADIRAGAVLYTHTDAGIFNRASNVFYRLKSVDIDGRSTYSAIIQLNVQKRATISVFPNPVRDMITIGGLEAGGTIAIFTATGHLLQQLSVSSQSVVIGTASWQQGVYLLRYTHAGAVQAIKLVK